LAEKINNLCADNGIGQIIDMGSGQGYLDACLVFQYDRKVTGIDSNMHQTCCAKREVKRIAATKHKSKGQIQHVNRFVHPTETLHEITNGECDSTDRWLICGLHSCGDLTVACIHQFLQSDAKILSVVGCCYNLLNQETSFPLSKQIRKTGIKFGLPQLMLACQATARWDSSVITVFRKHLYRALLQLVLNDLGLLGRMGNARVGKVGDAFDSGFSQYCIAAFKNLGVDFPRPGITMEVLLDYEAKFAHREQEIAIYWTLRSMMAGVFESIILSDRKLYLEESGLCTVRLEPIFDEVVSPRNMLLLAVKNDLDNITFANTR
jgi:Methyltransferase domain